jgi:glycosyltransferase involved in cell wall biosynthesis
MATSETAAGASATAAPGVESKAQPKVSIVIPAFNEAIRIGGTLLQLRQYVERLQYPFEVIVVDDGSVDDTAAIVQRGAFPGLRLLRNRANRGKGYAVRQGVLGSSGDYVLFSDADLSTPITELQTLLDVALNEDADIVIGSRAVDRSLIDRHQSWGREYGGIVFNVLMKAILGLPYHDTQCGFKLFRRERVLAIFEKQSTEGFGFDPEILFMASRRNLKVREVPVRWSHADGSKIRFVSDGFKMFLDLARIRWNHILGRYS